MRQLVICLFTLLIGLPAVGRGQDMETTCPYLAKLRMEARKCCRDSAKCCQNAKACCQDGKNCCCAAACNTDKTACQAKATTCQTGATACQDEENACQCQAEAVARLANVLAEASAVDCQAKAGTCATQATACHNASSACQADSVACHADKTACQDSPAACAACPSDEKIAHLKKAARHLHAAGLQSEAKRVLATAEALRRDVLAKKLAQLERLQAEIHALQHAAEVRQQVLIRVQIAEVSRKKLRKIGLELPKSGFELCEPQAIARFIDALRKDGVAKVLAAPNVVTVDGRPCSYAVVDEVPAACAGAEQPTESHGHQVGTQIDAVPTLLEDGKVRLRIRARHSAAPCVAGAHVQVRELNTDCELELGKTAVISGLLQQHVDHKHPGNQPDEVETLFLITPELVDAASPLEQPKSAEAPKPVPAPTAWAPAATRKQ